MINNYSAQEYSYKEVGFFGLCKHSDVREGEILQQEASQGSKGKNEIPYIDIFISSPLGGMDQSYCKTDKEKKEITERNQRNA